MCRNCYPSRPSCNASAPPPSSPPPSNVSVSDFTDVESKELFEQLIAVSNNPLTQSALIALRDYKIECSRCKMYPDAYEKIFCCYKDAEKQLNERRIDGNNDINSRFFAESDDALASKLNRVNTENGDQIKWRIAAVKRTAVIWQLFLKRVLSVSIHLLNILCCCLEKNACDQDNVVDKRDKVDAFIRTVCCGFELISKWAVSVIRNYSFSVISNGEESEQSIYQGKLASNGALQSAFISFCTTYEILRAEATCPCKY